MKSLIVCMVSIDVEEDIRNDNRKVFKGVENLNKIMNLFNKYNIRSTLFVKGEVMQKYPDLVLQWSKKHEISCHGNCHIIDRSKQGIKRYMLSKLEREKQLKYFCKLYEDLFDFKPKGFRAEEFAIDQLQLKLLEKYDFEYDSSVLSNYPFFIKNIGYKGKAPTEPYHPSYENYKQKGDMKILEIPFTTLAFGFPLSGTWIRVFGQKSHKFLLTLKKPRFIGLMMHPWDAIEHEGTFSKNSGEKFLGYLDTILEMLCKNYKFKSGEEILRICQK